MDDARSLSMEGPKEETMVSSLLSFNYSVTPLYSHSPALWRNVLWKNSSCRLLRYPDCHLCVQGSRITPKGGQPTTCKQRLDVNIITHKMKSIEKVRPKGQPQLWELLVVNFHFKNLRLFCCICGCNWFDCFPNPLLPAMSLLLCVTHTIMYSCRRTRQAC